MRQQFWNGRSLGIVAILATVLGPAALVRADVYTDKVVPFAPMDVCARAVGIQRVVAGPAAQCVGIARRPAEPAMVARKGVVARAAVQAVIAGTAAQRIIAIAA